MTIELHGTTFTVSATEKRSLGDCENITEHTSLEGEIRGVGELDERDRTELRAKLLALHKDVQETVERAADNRVAVAKAEDWGVRRGEASDDD